MMKAPERRAALICAASILVLASTVVLAEAPASQPSAKPAPAAAAPASPPAEQPAHVTVQHILIGFEGSVRGKNITRTKEAARSLAAEVLAKAQKGEDFDALVKQYTDDRAPGIYAMANNDVAIAPLKPGTKASGREFPRGGMAKSFGDVAFSLKVGEIGMAEYDHANSPFGWHIIKRLE